MGNTFAYQTLASSVYCTYGIKAACPSSLGSGNAHTHMWISLGLCFNPLIPSYYTNILPRHLLSVSPPEQCWAMCNLETYITHG
jgi:hypothetical protein